MKRVRARTYTVVRYTSRRAGHRGTREDFLSLKQAREFYKECLGKRNTLGLRMYWTDRYCGPSYATKFGPEKQWFRGKFHPRISFPGMNG